MMQQYPVPRRSQAIREIASATGQRVVSDFIGGQKSRFGLWAAIGQEGVNGWGWDLVRRVQRSRTSSQYAAGYPLEAIATE